MVFQVYKIVSDAINIPIHFLISIKKIALSYTGIFLAKL